MSKSKTMTPDTSTAGKATAFTDDELKAVSGGAVDLKGADQALTQRAVQAQMLRLCSK